MARYILIFLLFIPLAAQAKSRTFTYKGPANSPLIWVSPGTTTVIVMPTEVKRIVTTLSDADISYILEGRRFLLTPLATELNQAIIIYLATGKIYEVRIRDAGLSKHDWRKADSRAEITDPNRLAETETVKESPKVTGDVEDPRRLLARAMWRSHSPVPPGISVAADNSVLSTSDSMELRRIRKYDAGDFYGHTLLVSNHSNIHLPLDITSFDAEGLCVIGSQVIRDGRASPGDVVAPGGKALMYLIFKAN